MKMICICLSAAFMLISFIFAVLFNRLGRKAVIFLPKYKKIPKEDLEDYNFDRIIEDAADVCITGIFFWLIAACLIFSTVALYVCTVIGFTIWLGFVYYETPEQLYDTYRRVGKKA